MRIMNLMMGTIIPKSVGKMKSTLDLVKNNNGKLPKELEVLNEFNDLFDQNLD